MSVKHQFVLIVIVFVFNACASSGQKQVPVDPDRRAKTRTELAIGYLERNQLAIARQELERALELSPNHSRANQYMALLQLKLKRPNHAEGYFKTAIKSDPENSAAAHDYGVFLCRRGQLNEALKMFNMAISNPLYPRSDLSNMRAGECLMKANRHLRAEKYIKQALKQNSRLAPALYDMAIIQNRKNNNLSARGYIERYFSIGKETPSTLMLAIRIENSLSSPRAAHNYQQKLLTRFPVSKQAKQIRKNKKRASE